MLNKLITYENIRNFCYTNDKICKKPIKGLVFDFFGLGDKTMIEGESDNGKFYAENGILLVSPYNNPWAWMNPQALAYTDEIKDILFEKYALPEDLPIVASGGSMGGLSALLYTRNAKKTPVACVTNCPVCDPIFQFKNRPSFQRTMYSAFWHEDGDLEDVLMRYSPYHLAESMPDIKYRQFHCADDTSVEKGMNSDRFVEKMKKLGKDITYEVVPDKGHCELSEEAAERYRKYILDAILDSGK